MEGGEGKENGGRNWKERRRGRIEMEEFSCHRGVGTPFYFFTLESPLCLSIITKYKMHISSCSREIITLSKGAFSCLGAPQRPKLPRWHKSKRVYLSSTIFFFFVCP